MTLKQKWCTWGEHETSGGDKKGGKKKNDPAGLRSNGPANPPNEVVTQCETGLKHLRPKGKKQQRVDAAKAGRRSARSRKIREPFEKGEKRGSVAA